MSQNNMTAKEMFEELGWAQEAYEELYDKPTYIMYQFNDTDESGTIIFDCMNHTIDVARGTDFYEIIPTFKIRRRILNAINKQCEELGWL